MKKMEQFIPSVIILDLLMPAMNGFEFLHNLQERSKYKNVPVIVMTAKDLSPEERGKLTTNVQKVFCKGVCDRQTLLEDVKHFLSSVVSRAKSNPPKSSPTLIEENPQLSTLASPQESPPKAVDIKSKISTGYLLPSNNSNNLEPNDNLQTSINQDILKEFEQPPKDHAA